MAKIHYRCSICGQMEHAEWKEEATEFVCPLERRSLHNFSRFDTGRRRTRSELVSLLFESETRFDSREAPEFLAMLVRGARGRVCYIPGCRQLATQLDHVHPWSNNGPTSYHNLRPCCESHNKSKGDSELAEWMHRVPRAS
jgi:5-methylcytosine-specific restriction endonuclease McrA